MKKSSNVADFYVDFMESQLQIGDEFFTYDTHHKVIWKVVDIKAAEDKFILECSRRHGLGYNDQFAGAVVNTEGVNKLDLFRYGDPHEKGLYDPNSFIYKQLKRIKEQRSGKD
jgi:hypothetical protein